MPTEHDYERAAGGFRAVARLLDDQATWAPRSPATGFVTSPPIATVIDDAQLTAIRLIVRAADEIRRTAALCDERALVCREHRHAVRAYEAVPPEIRAHLAAPQPPAPWVER